MLVQITLAPANVQLFTVSTTGCNTVQGLLPKPGATRTSTSTATLTRTKTLRPTPTLRRTPTNTLTPTPVPTLTSLGNEKVKQLIAQLGSTNLDACKDASAQLSAMGNKLSAEHVLKIVQVMRTGSSTWQTSSWRGPHCTYYSYITTKYYAAKTLLSMQSAYVTDEIAAEATTAKLQGTYTTKIDDPGWI